MDRWLPVGAAVVATAALASGLGTTDLWPPDEPRVAEIAREMAVNESWLVPTLNGQPFLEEPPLFYWWQAGAYHVVGAPSTAAARFPAAMAAIAGALVTAALAMRLGANPVVAVLVLTTLPEYWWMARSATPDTAAAAATALALGCFFVAWQAGRRGLLVAAVGAAGMAFGCKSLLPVGLAVLTMAAFVAGAGWGRLHLGDVAWAVAGIVAITGAWVGWLGERLGGSAASFFVIGNHLGRILGRGEEGHVRSFLYYIGNLSLDLFPWSVVLPAALAAAWRARGSSDRRFPLLWAGVMLSALTVSASKRAHYLLPAYPAFALLIAQWWPNAWRGRLDRAARRLMIVAVVIVGPVLTLIVLSVRAEQVEAAAHALRETPAAWAAMLRDLAPTRSPWLAVVVLLLLGVLLLRADRERNPARTATALAAYVTGIHLLLTLVVLPRLNPLSTTRPDAERLRQLADRGVQVVAFGADDNTALSPILFYARHQLPKIENVGTLVTQLRTRPTCALIRAEDYARLAPMLSAPAVPRRVLPGSRFVFLETAPGLCTP